MPRTKRPRRGSKAYWPGGRAARIYPVVNWARHILNPRLKEVRPLGFAGYKASMTSVKLVDKNKNSPTFGQTVERPVTILDCPPLFVFGLRFYDHSRVASEIWSEKLDKSLSYSISLPKHREQKVPSSFSEVRLLVHTQPQNSGLGKKTPEVFELALSGEDAKKQHEYAQTLLGKELHARDVFKEGEELDAVAVTRGKGTSGVVQRFGVKIQNRHAKQKRRHIGTLGAEGFRRVLPGVIPHAGQLGFQTRTQYNNRIVKIGTDGKEVTPSGGFIRYGNVPGEYIMIEGSLPGARNRLVRLRHGLRAGQAIPTEIKSISK
jgi:large subunit ribosomal protein L3